MKFRIFQAIAFVGLVALSIPFKAHSLVLGGGGGTLSSVVASAVSFSPSDLPNLTLYLDGTALAAGRITVNGSNEVTAWTDKSASARTFTGSSGSTLIWDAAASAVKMPAGGNPQVVDTGGALISKGSAFTTAIRVKHQFTAYGQTRRLYSLHDGTNSVPITSANYTGFASFLGFFFGNSTWKAGATGQTLTANAYRTLIVTYNGAGHTDLANFSCYVDGVTISLISSSLSSYDTVTENLIGGDGEVDAYTKAVVLYSRVINATERGKLEAYLGSL